MIPSQRGWGGQAEHSSTCTSGTENPERTVEKKDVLDLTETQPRCVVLLHPWPCQPPAPTSEISVWGPEGCLTPHPGSNALWPVQRSDRASPEGWSRVVRLMRVERALVWGQPGAPASCPAKVLRPRGQDQPRGMGAGIGEISHPTEDSS